MWCPKHRWEFTNPSFTVCPACGTELVDRLVPDPAPAEVPAPEPAPTDAGDRTVTASLLGGFDRLAAPMLLDLLSEKGIRAFEADKPSNPLTRGFEPMLTEIWVEASALADARRIVEEELPAFVEQSVTNVLEPETDDEEGDDDEIEWSTFGWMETHVATAFLQICAEEAISAQTEYPLDRPPPVWATPGLRVQMHVDALFVEEAERLLDRLEQRLEEQGTEWEEPICSLSGP